MKTFSYMSTPDKILTRKSYLKNLAFVNLSILADSSLSVENVVNLQKEAARLQILIDALDAELLNE
ncbi:MAG: hypothetical protein WCI71_16550 [Bacteroidota bacterium]